jgi:hypothetical protein
MEREKIGHYSKATWGANIYNPLPIIMNDEL